MPPILVTPTPITPASTSYSLSSAGSIQASGVGGTVSGSWMVERQSLDIAYSRVPSVQLISEDITLSSTTATHSVTQSHVLCQVYASYSKKHEYGTYASSGWVQTQKFSIEPASGDYLGNTYGTISGTMLGPAGHIVTTQPWYSRRTWDPAIDTESTTASSMYSFVVTQNLYTTSTSQIAQGSYLNDFKSVCLAADFPGTFLFNWSPQTSTQWDYYLPGGYHTGQETEAKVLQYIDRMGLKVSNLDLYQLSPYSTLPDAGIPEYSIGRHDYT